IRFTVPVNLKRFSSIYRLIAIRLRRTERKVFGISRVSIRSLYPKEINNNSGLIILETVYVYSFSNGYIVTLTLAVSLLHSTNITTRRSPRLARIRRLTLAVSLLHSTNITTRRSPRLARIRRRIPLAFNQYDYETIPSVSQDKTADIDFYARFDTSRALVFNPGYRTISSTT
ncbi:hypothetical protein N7445_008885, partial [Penicillium cf. griseofulvum]